MSESGLPSVKGANAWVRNTPWVKTLLRVLFGVVWLIDGALKFTSGFVNNFSQAVSNSAANAPGFLSGWYAFWQTQANSQAYLIVYTVGMLELVLGIALVFGLLRKVAYLGGVVLSLLIWAVPEGFGGPYQGGAGGTDVGTGVIYALVFLGLILINASAGTSRFSLDYLIERRFPGWAQVAEFGVGGKSTPMGSSTSTARPQSAPGG